MKVKLADIIDAIEFIDPLSNYFLDMETGEIIMISDMIMTPEEIEEAYSTLDEHGFCSLPTQYELRDYDIMSSFVDSLSGTAHNRLASAISGRGAFRRFKDEVQRLGIEDQWYSWHNEAYKRKAARWCEENGIEYE